MSWEVRTMASTTSCFNSTLYRKTMQRFWPLWALYGLLWLFALPLNLLNQYFYTQRWDSVSQAQQQLLDWARNIPDLLSGGVLVSFFFGAVCAMAVFGYLYSSRSACMMHALPMRREGLFTTQYLAGVSFFLLPHLAVAFLTLAVELALLPPDSWAFLVGFQHSMRTDSTIHKIPAFPSRVKHSTTGFSQSRRRP